MCGLALEGCVKPCVFLPRLQFSKQSFSRLHEANQLCRRRDVLHFKVMETKTGTLEVWSG